MVLANEVEAMRDATDCVTGATPRLLDGSSGRILRSSADAISARRSEIGVQPRSIVGSGGAALCHFSFAFVVVDGGERGEHRRLPIRGAAIG